jgi:hypothetical protein
MFDRLKQLVNKIRAYDSMRWSGWMMIKRLLRAYDVIDTTVTSLIRQDPTFKRMTPDDILERIINHEMLLEESNYVKNLSKSVSSSKKRDISFKARKKGKNQRVVVVVVEEEEEAREHEYDPKEMTLFITIFSKLMNKQKIFKRDKKDKLRTKIKRVCYNYDKYSHFIVNCPYEHRYEDKYHKKDDDEAHISQEWDYDEENSESNSDGVITVAIKDSSFSSSSLKCVLILITLSSWFSLKITFPVGETEQVNADTQ